ncbi:MAG: hypothetical protein DCF19_14355 [Pseudanabaena frigida]|uniref:Uncharacterized protein n=1 Tax=Pseudanabaena frigida TaxID=945775 RepID=A0A2W4W458_9CYAN|nr:MAG: hypothetical protein DCF19_14355 [Pseudanabaena frigida]
MSTLQQLPIDRTTRRILKALLHNAFKILLGLGLSAKRCIQLTQKVKAAINAAFTFYILPNKAKLHLAGLLIT